MKKFTIILTCIVVGTMLSGCCSYLATDGHNRNIDQKALVLRLEGNQATLGVDILGAKGYLGAWKQSPGKMTLATLGDLALGAGLYYGGEAIANANDDDNRSSSGGASVDLNGNSGNVNITIVTGDGSNSNGDDATSGTSNRDMNE